VTPPAFCVYRIEIQKGVSPRKGFVKCIRSKSKSCRVGLSAERRAFCKLQEKQRTVKTGSGGWIAGVADSEGGGRPVEGWFARADCFLCSSLGFSTRRAVLLCPMIRRNILFYLVGRKVTPPVLTSGAPGDYFLSIAFCRATGHRGGPVFSRSVGRAMKGFLFFPFPLPGCACGARKASF